MSFQPVQSYKVICDGCGADYFEGSDYGHSEDPTPWLENDGSDWVWTEDHATHLCDGCHWKLRAACELLTGVEQ